MWPTLRSTLVRMMRESAMGQKRLTQYMDRTRCTHASDNGCWTFEYWLTGVLRSLQRKSSERQLSFRDPLHTGLSRRIGSSFGINTNKYMLITTLPQDAFLRNRNTTARSGKT